MVGKVSNFITQKKNQAVDDFEIDFYKLFNDAFFGKTMKTVHNRRKVEFTKNGDTDKIKKQQSDLKINGFRKSYENYDSYTFEQNEVVMDKPIYVGFATLEI